jgi:hypothetical protein
MGFDLLTPRTSGIFGTVSFLCFWQMIYLQENVDSLIDVKIIPTILSAKDYRKFVVLFPFPVV